MQLSRCTAATYAATFIIITIALAITIAIATATALALATARAPREELAAPSEHAAPLAQGVYADAVGAAQRPTHRPDERHRRARRGGGRGGRGGRAALSGSRRGCHRARRYYR